MICAREREARERERDRKRTREIWKILRGNFCETLKGENRGMSVFCDFVILTNLSNRVFSTTSNEQITKIKQTRLFIVTKDNGETTRKVRG